MKQRSTPVWVVVIAAVSIRSAVAAGPVVEQHWVPHTPDFQQFGVFDYTDLPGSERSVTIPAGTAVLVWSFNASGTGFDLAKIRPVIGPVFPAEGLAVNGYGSSGSWSTPTAGGTVTVKLQVANDAPAGGFAQNTQCCSLSWTLVVYPEAASADVPAVGGLGIGVTAIALVILGAAVCSVRRRRGVTE